MKNKKYSVDFNNAKDNYLKVIPTANQELIDSFLFKIEDDINIDHQCLNNYNSIALNLLQEKYNSTKGLCGMLSTLLLETSAIKYKEDFVFLTVGKVFHNNKNIFNIPEKDNVLSKIINDQNTYKKSLRGGNLHVWITLGNGIIIDPSISLTINNINNVIAGFANELDKAYSYEPYVIVDMKDVSKINSNNTIPKDVICHYCINDNFSKMDIIPQEINGYY